MKDQTPDQHGIVTDMAGMPWHKDEVNRGKEVEETPCPYCGETGDNVAEHYCYRCNNQW